MESLYRRPLPPDTIAFASPEGQQLFAEGLAAGGLGGYFALAEQYHTQSDPAFCGLGSLVVALNALAIDPGRSWKGPWRWFSEELLDCCVSLDEVRASGVDLDTLACLARCNGADATVARLDHGDDDRLRAAIARASRGPGEVIVVAYDRAALGQTGAGHFSPIAGYHAARDLVLVLDVARFKYPPHWVALARLAEATRHVDPTTGQPRGWLALRRHEGPQALCLSMARAGAAWPEVGRRLRVALAAPWPDDATPATLVASLVEIAAHCETHEPDDPAHAAAVAPVLAALRATEAHRIARPHAAGLAGADALAALLLLVAQLRPGTGPLAAELARLRDEALADPALRVELERLAAQGVALRALAM